MKVSKNADECQLPLAGPTAAPIRPMRSTIVADFHSAHGFHRRHLIGSGVAYLTCNCRGTFVDTLRGIPRPGVQLLLHPPPVFITPHAQGHESRS